MSYAIWVRENTKPVNGPEDIGEPEEWSMVFSSEDPYEVVQVFCMGCAPAEAWAPEHRDATMNQVMDLAFQLLDNNIYGVCETGVNGIKLDVFATGQRPS